MKCAIVTPVGPGHEKLFAECQESIRLAYTTSPGPFEDVLTISIDDTAGEIGRSAARNEAVKRAAADHVDWLFFLDADDLLLPEAFKTITPYIGAYDAIWGSIAEMKPGCEEAVLRTPQVAPIRDIENVLTADPFRTLQMGHFVRTQIALENRFDETMNTGEDFDYYLRVWDQWKCIKIEEPLFINRRGVHSIGPKSANGADWRISVEATIARYQKKYGIGPVPKSSSPPPGKNQTGLAATTNSWMKNAQLRDNLSLVKKRWPQMFKLIAKAAEPAQTELLENSVKPTLSISGIHLSSAYNPKQEAEIQATLIPNQSQKAWIYGIGLGELPRTLLLRKQLQELSVVVLNPAVARASFSHFDHSDWLSDPRVRLLPGDEENLGFPFAAAPSCLQLADETSARLRDLVFLELSTLYLNEKHGIKNSRIIERISQNEQFVKTDGNVATLFGSRPGATIMVAAAGPSLGENLKWIAANRTQYPLLAVNSALKPLARAGIIPDAVVVIDDDPKIISCFQDYDLSPLKKTPLIYFPRVPESVLEVWPGPRLCAYANHPTYQEIAQKYPRGNLYSSGSVLHPTVDLAVRMGAAEVILLGADLAFPGGQKYTPGAGWGDQEIPAAQHWVLDGHGNRVNTIASFRGYLRDLEIYIAKKPQIAFFNSSKEGAFIKGTAFLEERK